MERPEAPLAIKRTESLVLMSPSMVIRLKDRLTAWARVSWRNGFDTEASVVRKASMVAMFGSIMPAPLTTPPTVISPAEVSIFAEHDFVQVSEVRIAS